VSFSVVSAGAANTCTAKTKDYCPRPTVRALPAREISDRSAVLAGEVNPNGVSTRCFFRWGRTTTYGHVTHTQKVGSGNEFVNVDAKIAGLKADTKYHFRPVCNSAGHTVNGNGRAFRTKKRK
jgi:hypothetical protein